DRPFLVAEANLVISPFVSSSPHGIADRFCVTHTGTAAVDSSTVVCGGYLWRRLGFVYPGLSGNASPSSKSTRSAIALALANLILHLWLYCGDPYILPGRAGQLLGIISCFLSGRARRSDAKRLHAFVAWPRNLVGCFRVDLPNRFTFIANVCAAVSDH